MNATYPSNLTDAEWNCLQRFLPSRSPHGKLRRHCLRTIFDALFYLLRTGCPWRYLPSNFPPWQTVYYHFRQFCRTGVWTHLYRELREAERRRVGKDPHPSAAIMDAQSVKTVEESACISGFDAHKCVKGRKRHLLVDTLGLPISVYVTPADMHDTQGARRLLAGLKFFVPRLKKSGLMQHIVARSWRTGARQKATGIWKWWSGADSRRARIRGAAKALDGGTHIRLAFAQPPGQSRTTSERSRPAKH
jgi:putative transposase